MMQKIVNAKAKADLISNIIVQDSNIHYLRGHCFSNNIASKIQTKRIIVKNPHPKEAKAKDPKPALLHINKAKPLKQGRKDKKKRTKKHKQNYTGEQKDTLAIGDNTIDASKKDSRKKRNTSIIICYNYNKKNYYASNCIKV